MRRLVLSGAATFVVDAIVLLALINLVSVVPGRIVDDLPIELVDDIAVVGHVFFRAIEYILVSS